MSTCSQITAVIIDECPLFLDGLSDCLVDHAVRIGDRFDSLDTARRIVDCPGPDLIVLGPHLDEAATFEFCRVVRRSRHSARLIMFSADGSDPHLQADAAYVGFTACLFRNLSCEETINAIRLVANGYQMFPQGILPSDIATMSLTGQERRILRMLVPERTYAQIASHLGLQLPTVRNHAQHILEKLDAHNREAAARRAIRRGWLDVEKE